MRLSTFIGCTLSFLSAATFAAEPTKSAVAEYEYPELLVSPSASERLTQEAKVEDKNRYKEHWAIQVSAVSTLFAGVLAGSDPGKASNSDETKPIKTASLASIAVGGGWLAITGAMSAMYSPYQSGAKELATLPRGSKKETLAYERRAEEELAYPARISKVMKWSSFISNAAASGLVASNAQNNSAKIMGGISVINSLLPILFDHTWELNQKYQEDYKRRVYGPISYNNFEFGTHGNQVAGIWTTGLIF